MKSNREILGFNDWPLILVGVPIIGFFFPIVFFDHNPFSAPVIETVIATFISMGYSFIFWMSCRYIQIFYRRRFPDFADNMPRLISMGITVIASVLFISVTLNTLECVVLRGEPFQIIFKGRMVMGSLLLSSTLIAVYEGVYFAQKFREQALEAEQLKRANLQSQLETLKNQVNPHFLFNSLNTLASVIPEDSDLAVEFVQKLSAVYRYILEIKDKELISLEEELEFLHAFVFLLKIRFGENIQVHIDLPKEVMHHHIVPLSFQILFENAIKHNIISTQKPLKIEVFLEKGNIIVRNNLQKKKQVISSTKTGLQNISERYRLLTDRLVEIIVTTNAFMVSLPVINPTD